MAGQFFIDFFLSYKILNYVSKLVTHFKTKYKNIDIHYLSLLTDKTITSEIKQIKELKNPFLLSKVSDKLLQASPSHRDLF
jgi:hypothetical protein